MWCREGDLNPYRLIAHKALNLACLPIPPSRLIAIFRYRSWDEIYHITLSRVNKNKRILFT